MTPATFLARVVDPNVADAVSAAHDERLAVNAILTLDTLAGIIHAYGVAAELQGMARHRRDEGYKEALAESSPSFRLVRDVAASLKHGELRDPRRGLLPRLVVDPGAVHTSGGGMMGFGPISGGPIGSVPTVYIACVDDRREHASAIIQDAHAMLRAIVEGLPAE